jgi:rod shape determining protein RodA
MTSTFLIRRPDSGLGNIRRSPGDPSRNIDWVLMFVQWLLIAIGCFVVFSASRTRIEGDPYAFVNRQVVFAIVGAVVMSLVMSLDYEALKNRAMTFYVGTISLLLLLLLIGFARGEDRISFDLGPLNIQPAELAKFSTMLLLAAYLAEERTEEVSYPRFLGGLVLVGFPTVLVIVQPDLGSASVLVALVMGTLLVAGARPRYIVAVSVLATLTVVAAFVGRFVNDYQVNRLKVFLDQETTDPALQDAVYQARNAIRAVGTGGIWGKGWLQGPLTNGRDVPVMWADFPFAAVAEQFGLVGGAALIGVFGIALVRIWRIASLSKDLLGTYICAGVFTMLLWQVFQNIGMTLGITPVTGLPMPFISYGGSSLVVYCAMFGLVQSVHMRRMR